MPDADVTLYSPFNQTVRTDADGYYTIGGLPPGAEVRLYATRFGATFFPVDAVIPNIRRNETSNFTGNPPLRISGRVVNEWGSALIMVPMTLSGTATQLITRLASQASNTYEAYLKFDLGQRCTVSAVKLRLYGQLSSNSTLPVAVYAVPSTTWTETGTNWNNKPAAGTLLRIVSMTGTTARWYEWDVTDYVRAELAAGRSVVSFVLKSTSTTNYQAAFTSRQTSGTNAPRLAITNPLNAPRPRGSVSCGASGARRRTGHS